MSGMAVRAATPEEGARLARLLKTDAAVKMVHPVVSHIMLLLPHIDDLPSLAANAH